MRDEGSISAGRTLVRCVVAAVTCAQCGMYERLQQGNGAPICRLLGICACLIAPVCLPAIPPHPLPPCPPCSRLCAGRRRGSGCGRVGPHVHGGPRRGEAC